jgi:hypothetical protein
VKRELARAFARAFFVISANIAKRARPDRMERAQIAVGAGMSNSRKWPRLGALCLCGALAPALPAQAADRPADDAGVKTIADFLAAYTGKTALPALKITKEAASYLVSLDLAAMNPLLKPLGFSYDPAVMQFRAFQQDDGAWRIELADMPPISGHMAPPALKGAGQFDMRLEMTNLKHATLIDPKLNWIASVHGGADKVSLVQRGPGMEERLGFGAIKADVETRRGASGLVTTLSEPFGSMNFTMDVDPKAVGGAAKPVRASAQAEGGEISATLADFEPGPLLDAWRFAVAHPERADVARDFDALKRVVTALVGDSFTVAEKGKLAKLDITTQFGATSIEGAEFGFGAVNGGVDTGFSERFAARAIKLPEALVPAAFAPILPTSFDIGFKASGFDIAAAAQEWLADAKLDGDGPVMSEADQRKVTQKLVGGRPIVVDILPSHIAGPSLNIAFQGRVTIEMSHPVGAVTITVRDFDKTVEAVQGLDPASAQELAPAVVAAKALGKPGPDGSLVWICVLGHDRVIKVNGMPLGAAPF